MYDKLGRVPSTTSGERTRPTYSGVDNIEETVGAPGTSAFFTYDALNRLVKAGQRRVDTQAGIGAWEVVLYKFDGRGLITKQADRSPDKRMLSPGVPVLMTGAPGYLLAVPPR